MKKKNTNLLKRKIKKESKNRKAGLAINYKKNKQQIKAK